MVKGIVLVCDRVENRDGISIDSNDLEFTSPKYFEAISSAITSLSDRTFFYSDPDELIDNIEMHRDDIVMTAIWSGVQSRNRKALLPAICESYGIAYVGADAYVQSLCQSKYLSKLVCENYEITIPPGCLIADKYHIDDIKLISKYPVIVKPNLEGSSIGISDDSIADDEDSAREKVLRIIDRFSPVLVEECVDGREVSICLAGTKGNMIVCEAVELVVDGNSYFNHQVWGLESKKGGAATCDRRVVTNQIDQSIMSEAKRLFWDLGKVDYMRIDGRIDKDGIFHLIELTPDCSLHPDCFMYAAFRSNGYSYAEMIGALVGMADANDSSVSR